MLTNEEKPFNVKVWKDIVFSLTYILSILLSLPTILFIFYIGTTFNGGEEQIFAILDQNMAFVLLATSLLVCALAYFFYKDDLQKNWRDLKAKGKWWLIPLVWLIVLGGNLIIQWLFFESGATSANEEVIRDQFAKLFDTSWLALLAMVLVIGIFIPFIEELFFRKILISHTAIKLNIHIGITYAISGILFILAHSLGVFPDVFLYVPMTLGFSYIYHYYHQNVVASTIIHIINNSFSVIMMWLSLTQLS